MITIDEISALLQTVNVEAVARESGLATKTIYRLRHKRNSPTLVTLEKLLPAIDRVRERDEKQAA
jgi:DNA-binding phage protein